MRLESEALAEAASTHGCEPGTHACGEAIHAGNVAIPCRVVAFRVGGEAVLEEG
jgi:hypothetical protein